MPNVMEGTSSLLHALTVLVHGGIALSHRVELLDEEGGVRSLVGLEQRGNHDPEITSVLVIFHGEVKYLIGDITEDPAMDGAVR